uniref:Uncharacterized protein n=1 Tax=Glycine max TaxID=3847 RepID=A0A0R0KFR9_SOYBN
MDKRAGVSVIIILKVLVAQPEKETALGLCLDLIPSISLWGYYKIKKPKFQVLGRESLRSELSGKIANETWSSKICIQDNFSKGNGSEAQNAVNKDMSSIYQDQRVQPCHLSSSIYYGGQDIYSSPQSTQNEGFNSMHRNVDGEDGSEFASRGDWWQGGLYY